MTRHNLLKEKLHEAAASVLPIAAIVVNENHAIVAWFKRALAMKKILQLC